MRKEIHSGWKCYYLYLVTTKTSQLLTERVCSCGFRTEEPSKSKISQFNCSFSGDEDVCWLDVCNVTLINIICHSRLCIDQDRCQQCQIITNKSNVQQVRQWGMTYIHTCQPTSTHRMIFHEQSITSVTFMVGFHTVNFYSLWLADSSDFRLVGSKVPQNGRFSAQDADEPPCKIWRR